MPPKPTTDPQKYHVPGQGWRVKIAGRAYRLGRDEVEAERRRRELVGRWLSSGASSTNVHQVTAVGEETVAGAIAEFLDRGLRRSINRRNRIRYRDALLFVAELYGDSPASQFGALELKRVRAAMGKRRARPKCSESGDVAGRLLSRKYINQMVGCIKTAWDWLASERLVPAARSQELRSVKSWAEGDGGEERPDILPAPAADIDAVLPHLNPVVAAMVRLQTLTGMRPNEVRRMKRREISTCATEVLHPPNALPTAAVSVGDVLVWVYAPSEHKTRRKGKPRLIVLGPACQPILMPFLTAAGPDDFLFRPVEAAGGRVVLGGKPVAAGYSETSYAHAIRRACLRAGVKPWRPGQLRHGVATDLFADDPLGAMATLGHGHLQMTQYYAAANLRRAAEIAARQAS